MKRFIIFSIFLLAFTLACQAAQRLIAPATPTQVPPTSTPLEPSPTASPTEVPPPTPTPEPTRIAPTPVSCTDDSCLNACLDRINEELGTSSLGEVGGNYEGTNANFNLVTYKVEGDKIVEPDTLWVPSEYKEYQQDTASQLRVWNYFTSLIPPEQRKWITRYVIFTDGVSNILAWVSQVNYNDNSKWELGVDVLDSANPVDLTETITHEVGHLLTLNSDQIIQSGSFLYTPYQNSATCKQFMTTEGCSTPDSYINQFYQKFWTGIYDDWLKIVYESNPTNQDELFAAVADFYGKYSRQFARPYAATNIKEDMAVSFEYFILKPKPTGNSIVAQKILFYYDYPEMVSLRQRMIQSICSYVQQ